MLDTGAHLSAIAADSEAIADLADGHLDQAVPTCPEWTVADVVGHLGGIYSWVWLIIQAGGEKPDGDRDLPPADRSSLVDWFREERTAVIDALSSKEPDDPAWTFIRAAPQTVGWWRRRQAMETAVHLYDVEAAAGRPRAVAPDLAADGVDEIVTSFMPGYLRHNPVEGLEGTIHLHCTDAEGEWVLDFRGPAVEVRREHTKADTAVRGPASDLFLWLWNRSPLDTPGLEVFGRREVVAALSKIRL
jgi:uncharacterized protein (TIGR03083 family)